jgi:hypothetical protein
MLASIFDAMAGSARTANAVSRRSLFASDPGGRRCRSRSSIIALTGSVVPVLGADLDDLDGLAVGRLVAVRGRRWRWLEDNVWAGHDRLAKFKVESGHAEPLRDVQKQFLDHGCEIWQVGSCADRYAWMWTEIPDARGQARKREPRTADPKPARCRTISRLRGRLAHGRFPLRPGRLGSMHILPWYYRTFTILRFLERRRFHTRCGCGVADRSSHRGADSECHEQQGPQTPTPCVLCVYRTLRQSRGGSSFPHSRRRLFGTRCDASCVFAAGLVCTLVQEHRRDTAEQLSCTAEDAEKASGPEHPPPSTQAGDELKFASKRCISSQTFLPNACNESRYGCLFSSKLSFSYTQSSSCAPSSSKHRHPRKQEMNTQKHCISSQTFCLTPAMKAGMAASLRASSLFAARREALVPVHILVKHPLPSTPARDELKSATRSTEFHPKLSA